MTVLDTPQQIEAFGLLQLRSRLKLEILGMTCHGKTAYSTIKSMIGLKGSKVKVLAQFEEILKDNNLIQGDK